MIDIDKIADFNLTEFLNGFQFCLFCIVGESFHT